VPVTAYIGLGANLGDTVRSIQGAIDQLRGLPRTEVSAVSSFYRSAPVGHASQPDFVNAVARVDTALAARALLDALLGIEARAGRERSFADAPRTLDLDLLLYGDARIAEPGLTVPHPRMHERRFVLEPLAEIAPECAIPGIGRAAERLRETAGQDVSRMQPGP
jgi:2-amino-4-hydroxy-6-hydroxymethyldihydropteridine diphosphokinase